MKKKYLIKDVELNEYYFSYQDDSKFIPGVKDAKHYDGHSEALSHVTDYKNNSIFKGRIIEIVEYIIIE